MNNELFSVENCFESSIASLIDTFKGISGNFKNSVIAIEIIILSIVAILEISQF